MVQYSEKKINATIRMSASDPKNGTYRGKNISVAVASAQIEMETRQNEQTKID